MAGPYIVDVGDAFSTTSPITINPATAVPAGTTIVILGFFNGTSAGSTTASDTKGNSYVLKASQSGNNISTNTFVQALVSETGNALTTSDTITITNATVDATNGMFFDVAYIVGLASGTKLDAAVTATSFGTGTSASITSGTPGVAGEMMIALATNVTTIGATTGNSLNWLNPWAISNIAIAQEYYGTSAQTVVQTVASGPWAALILGFKLAAVDPNLSFFQIIAGTSPATGTLQRAIPAGALIVVDGYTGAPTGRTCKITDTQGNLYKYICEAPVGGNGLLNGCEVWFYSYNIAPLTTSDVITMTDPFAGGNGMGMAFNYSTTISGSQDPLDHNVTATSCGQGNPYSVSSGVPTQTNELFFVALGGVEVAGAPFTTQEPVPAPWTWFWLGPNTAYTINSGLASQTFSGSFSVSAAWSLAVFAFRNSPYSYSRPPGAAVRDSLGAWPSRRAKDVNRGGKLLRKAQFAGSTIGYKLENDFWFTSVSFSLTGVSATASAGTFARIVAFTLAGAIATAGAGSFTPKDQPATLTGEGAVSSAGSLAITEQLTFAGASATAAAGALTPSVITTLAGASATSAAGSFSERDSPSLTGASATSGAGALSEIVIGSFSGVGGVSGAGTLVPTEPTTLTGASATSGSGSFTTSAAGTLAHASATAAAAAIGLAATFGPGGAIATTGSAGSISFQGQLVGASAAGSPGSLTDSISFTATGASATAAAGSIAPTDKTTLVGAGATSAAGSIGIVGLTGALPEASAIASAGALGLVGTFGFVGIGVSATGQAGTIILGGQFVAASATGGAGSFTDSVAGSFAGATATAAAGAITPQAKPTLAGASATAAAGVLAPVGAFGLSGAAAMSGVGTFALTVGALPGGAAATAGAGFIQTQGQLGSAQATGSPGSLAGQVIPSTLIGASASSSAGTFAPAAPYPLAGVAAASSAGQMAGEVTTGALTGVSAIAAAGPMAITVLPALTGGQAVAAAGFIVPAGSRALAGVSAASGGGSLVSDPGGNPAGVEATASAGVLGSVEQVIGGAAIAVSAAGSISGATAGGFTGAGATGSAGEFPGASITGGFVGVGATGAAAPLIIGGAGSAFSALVGVSAFTVASVVEPAIVFIDPHQILRVPVPVGALKLTRPIATLRVPAETRSA